MIQSLPFLCFLGTVFGFLSGIGIGGGSLLFLWLTLGLDMSQESARIINLLFFLPSALAASFFRWKQGALDLKRISPAILSGCLFAGVFSWIGMNLDTSLLRKLFGILLIFTGIRELTFKPKKNGS